MKQTRRHPAPAGRRRSLWFLALVSLAASSLPLARPAEAQIPTEPNLKVAVIGDTGYGQDFDSVLTLIRDERADLVVHSGDFDYTLDPDRFESVINGVLGPTFPYFASVGNHDLAVWQTGCGNSRGCYADHFAARMRRIGVAPDDPDLNDFEYAVTYKGLKMVFGWSMESAPFIRRQLSGDRHIWSICNWHRNQRAMQVANKQDEMGWEVYETCRTLGAIVTTGHAHGYHRTKTLMSLRNQTVDPRWPHASHLRVVPGATFVVVSGLGGNPVTGQDRCRPTTYPYGCRGEWAKIYTADQRARFGALFIELNVEGNPYKANGYFKNIDGECIDEFAIDADPDAAPPPIDAAPPSVCAGSASSESVTESARGSPGS